MEFSGTGTTVDPIDVGPLFASNDVTQPGLGFRQALPPNTGAPPDRSRAPSDAGVALTLMPQPLPSMFGMPQVLPMPGLAGDFQTQALRQQQAMLQPMYLQPMMLQPMLIPQGPAQVPMMQPQLLMGAQPGLVQGSGLLPPSLLPPQFPLAPLGGPLGGTPGVFGQPQPQPHVPQERGSPGVEDPAKPQPTRKKPKKARSPKGKGQARPGLEERPEWHEPSHLDTEERWNRFVEDVVGLVGGCGVPALHAGDNMSHPP